MQDLLIIAVHGIGAGAIFALVGMSFNVVFNASGSQLLSAGEDSRITRWNVAGAKKELSSGTQ